MLLQTLFVSHAKPHKIRINLRLQNDQYKCNGLLFIADTRIKGKIIRRGCPGLPAQNRGRVRTEPPISRITIAYFLAIASHKRRVGYTQQQRHRRIIISILYNHPLTYRVPFIYGTVNTTAEPAPFPDWLGFPTSARLSVACHHDRREPDTALSAEQMNVSGNHAG